jgi:hypothetical protein
MLPQLTHNSYSVLFSRMYKLSNQQYMLKIIIFMVNMYLKEDASKLNLLINVNNINFTYL